MFSGFRKKLRLLQARLAPRYPGLRYLDEGRIQGLVGRSRISVGRFTYGFDGTTIRQWREGASLEIGSFCSIGNDLTVLLGGNHRIDWLSTYPFGHVFTDRLIADRVAGHPSTKGDVRIGSDVWIGSHVTILSGVRIGDGAVIGTNATVARDVASYDVVAGNPATRVRSRFSAEVVSLLLLLRWWELPVEDIRALVPLLCATPDADALRRAVERYRAREVWNSVGD